jgi:hypothetical protein
MTASSAIDSERARKLQVVIPDRASERRPLSEQLWGLRWTDHLPLDLGHGATVHASSFEQCTPFIRAHYARIFHDDGTSPFKSDALTPQKARYYELCADFSSSVSAAKSSASSSAIRLIGARTTYGARRCFPSIRAARSFSVSSKPSCSTPSPQPESIASRSTYRLPT